MPRGKKTPLPDDFSVSDGDREWAVRRGYPLYICDIFLPALRHWAHDPNTDPSKAKKVDWHSALKTWVRREAEKQTLKWDRAVAAAKDMEEQRFTRSTPQYYDPSHSKAGPAPMPDVTRGLLEKMRAQRGS